MSSEVFTDAAMLEIFRAEVETHIESLTAGLLALERDPTDTSHIDEMMRAAHSIKGPLELSASNRPCAWRTSWRTDSSRPRMES